MTNDASDFLPDDNLPSSSGSGAVTVQELTWALIDEQIDDGELELLESMLLSDNAARSEYIHCVQLHTDLMFHFAKPAAGAVADKSPVLGFLNEGVPPFGVQPTQQ